MSICPQIGVRLVLAGQNHTIADEVLIPVLNEFLLSHPIA
jgi:hypothetical protein